MAIESDGRIVLLVRRCERACAVGVMWWLIRTLRILWRGILKLPRVVGGIRKRGVGSEVTGTVDGRMARRWFERLPGRVVAWNETGAHLIAGCLLAGRPAELRRGLQRRGRQCGVVVTDKVRQDTLGIVGCVLKHIVIERI